MQVFLFCPHLEGNDLRAESDIHALWPRLDRIWEEIRVKCQGENVATAVAGSDLARIGNTVSNSSLIKLIVSLFTLSSRQK